MTETVIIALIGTIVSGVISAVMANRITVYRIDALTREVERHNQVIERTYRLEQRVDDMDGRLNRVENNR